MFYYNVWLYFYHEKEYFYHIEIPRKLPSIPITALYCSAENPSPGLILNLADDLPSTRFEVLHLLPTHRSSYRSTIKTLFYFHCFVNTPVVPSLWYYSGTTVTLLLSLQWFYHYSLSKYVSY